jgi:hypothetical protein
VRRSDAACPALQIIDHERILCLRGVEPEQGSVEAGGTVVVADVVDETTVAVHREHVGAPVAGQDERCDEVVLASRLLEHVAAIRADRRGGGASPARASRSEYANAPPCQEPASPLP